MSKPTPEEAFLEYARSTGWDETAVRVVLDTVRTARRAAALEMRERCAAAVNGLEPEDRWDCGTWPHACEAIAAAVRALDVP